MLVMQRDPPSPMIYNFYGCDLFQPAISNLRGWFIFALPTLETHVVC